MKRNINLILTRMCNLNCVYCFSERRKENLDFNNLMQLIDQLDEFEDFTFNLTGGEPFLYPNITDVIEIIGKKKGKCNIFTNGTIINKKILQILKKYNYRLFISLDSLNESINDQLRGKLNTVLENIQMICSEGILVTIECVLSKKNYHEIGKMIDFTRSKGLEIHFNPIADDSIELSLSNLEKSELENLLKSIFAYKDLMDKRNFYYIYAFLKNINIKKLMPCNIPENNIVIDSDGNAYSCYYNKKKVGSLNCIKELINYITNEFCEDCREFTTSCIGLMD